MCVSVRKFFGMCVSGSFPPVVYPTPFQKGKSHSEIFNQSTIFFVSTIFVVR